MALDYNNLPTDPVDLYRAMIEEAPLTPADDMLGPGDMAISAPTWGSENGCIVLVCMAPSAERAYKILLNRRHLIDLQRWVDTALSRPDLVALEENRG